MKAVIVILLSVLVSVPVLAGPPNNGTYKSTDIGGTMLPGRYSEYWATGPLSVNNTLNEQSWNGALGTEWHWYCPWITGKVLLVNTVNGAGNGQKIWRVNYTGGYCWISNTGPWGRSVLSREHQLVGCDRHGNVCRLHRSRHGS